MSSAASIRSVFQPGQVEARASESRLPVRVRSITYQGQFINAYEVVALDGRSLPRFTAGAHIDLYFRDGRIRQYSLCSDPEDTHHYVFAVQREEEGRGGSKAIFELVHVGRILTVSTPRNNFPLARDAERHLMLAGGIGVTPMMSMIYELNRAGRDFALHYCARSREKAAFLEDLALHQKGGRVFFHYDGGDPSRGLDIQGLLRDFVPGTHLYYCGPVGFMTAVKRAAAHWPVACLHYEYFTPAEEGAMPEESAPPTDAEGSIGVGFQVKVASTGAVFDVPNDKSIVQVLREHGIEVATSCESGLCGTCRTRFLEGVPEHRDYILTDEEKLHDVLICCARSKTPLLVLDL